MTTATRTSGETWDLREGAVRKLPGGPGVVVRVERGTVLVTREGDLADHVLEPGDALDLSGAGRAVAWAFTDATLSVEGAARRWRPTMRKAA